MSGSPTEPHNPDNLPALPGPTEPEAEHLLVDDPDQELAPDSVLGDDDLPAMQANLSDGSTKVMTNQALHEMGLQVPDWRAGSPVTETFALPDQAPPSAEGFHLEPLGVPLPPPEIEPIPAPENEDLLTPEGFEALNLDGPTGAMLPKLDESGELGDLDESVVAFTLPSAEPLANPETPLNKSGPLKMPLAEALPPPQLPPSLPRPTNEPPVSPTLEMPMLVVADTIMPPLSVPDTTVPPPVPVVTSAPAPASPAATPVAIPRKPATPTPPAPAEPGSRASLAWTLLISYASAITLALIYLLMAGGGGARTHHLESLPDVAPEPPKELSYAPPTMEVAPGHALKLGERRRFGNIEVEPLRVTKEPIQFTHYSGNSKTQRPPTEPVLKLWLRFKNVSSDQTIAPLDAPLLFKYVVKSGADQEYANQYLFPVDKRSDTGAIVSIYSHPIHADWDLVGQNLGQALTPGESLETFIPSTDDGTAEIKAPVAWRVQLRKGLGPAGKGVTTLIEVLFDWKQIEMPSA